MTNAVVIFDCPQLYDYWDREQTYPWSTWAEFVAAFKEEFFEQESQTLAFLKLEGSGYYQG